MEEIEEFEGKHVVLLGFGVENRAAADFMLSHGAKVTAYDEKNREAFDSKTLKEYEQKGVAFGFGAFPDIDSCDLVVRTSGLRPDIPVLQKARKKGIVVTSAVNIFLKHCPCPIIGITGTKGKGTTATLIHKMLVSDGKKVFLGGNIGNPVLSFLDDITPEALAVIEMSSFQLMDIEQSPHIAVVLSVTKEHLDFHKDENEYVRAKANIVRFQERDDIAIVNAEYENSGKIADYATSRKLWIRTTGSDAEGCFIQDGKIMIAMDGKKEEILSTKKVVLPGPHNLENACAAALAAYVAGVSRESIVKVLTTFSGLPQRLEFIREFKGVKYYSDSFSTIPESAIAAINSFPEPKILILGGSPKGSDFMGLGKAIASDKTVKAVIGIGDEWPRIKEAIERECNEKGTAPPSYIENCISMKEIVRGAKTIAESGNIVLLSPACASFDMFENYKERGKQFDEEVSALS